MSTSDNNLFLIRSLLVDEVRRLQAILDAKDGEITSLSGIEPLEAKAEAGVPLHTEMSALAIHLRDIGCPGESMDLQAMADRMRYARPAPADALREAVRYALDVFSQYDGKHIMQALQFTDHIKKMAAALARLEGEKK